MKHRFTGKLEKSQLDKLIEISNLLNLNLTFSDKTDKDSNDIFYMEFDFNPLNLEYLLLKQDCKINDLVVYY